MRSREHEHATLKDGPYMGHEGRQCVGQGRQLGDVEVMGLFGGLSVHTWASLLKAHRKLRGGFGEA